jgi:hypothetical protein
LQARAARINGANRPQGRDSRRKGLKNRRCRDELDALVQPQKGGDRMSNPLVNVFAATAVAGVSDDQASITLAT